MGRQILFIKVKNDITFLFEKYYAKTSYFVPSQRSVAVKPKKRPKGRVKIHLTECNYKHNTKEAKVKTYLKECCYKHNVK